MNTKALLKELNRMVGLQNLSPYNILRIRKCGLNGIVGTPSIPNGGYVFSLRFKLNKENKVITVFTKCEFGKEPFVIEFIY